MSLPDFDVVAHNAVGHDHQTKTNATKEVLRSLVGLFNFEEVFHASKQHMLIHGDVFFRPYMHSFQNKKGKIKYEPRYEAINIDKIIIDPSAKSMTNEFGSNDAKWYAIYELYSKQDVISRFGDAIIEKIEPGSPFDGEKNYKEEEHLLPAGEKEFYGVLEYHNKVERVSAVVIGKERYAQTLRAPKTEEKSNDTEVRGEYLYYDFRGKPLLMLSNLFCYRNINSLYNHGMVDVLADSQSTQALFLNMLARSIFLQQQGAIDVFITAMPEQDLKKKVTSVVEARQKGDYSKFLVFNPLAGASFEHKTIVPHSMDFTNTSTMIGLFDSLARNAVGVAPNQGEARATSVGQESILEDQRLIAIEGVAKANLLNIKHALENMIYFAVAHKGFEMNYKYITYTKVGFMQKEESLFNDSDREVPHRDPMTGEITSYSYPVVDPLPKVLEYIEDFECFVEITKDSFIKRDIGRHLDRILQVMGATDPNVEPRLRARITSSALAMMGIAIQPGDMSGLDQMAEAQLANTERKPRGGIDQFPSGDGPASKKNDNGVSRPESVPGTPGRPNKFSEEERSFFAEQNGIV